MTIPKPSKLIRISILVNLGFAVTAHLVRIVFSHLRTDPINPIEYVYVIGWLVLPCAVVIISDLIARKRGAEWTTQAEKHLIRLPARAGIGLLTALILTIWAAPNINGGEGTVDTVFMLGVNLTGLFTGYGIAGWLFRVPEGRWSAMLPSHVMLFCLAPITWILILLPLFLGMRSTGRLIY
jgi:hypothetical protein